MRLDLLLTCSPETGAIRPVTPDLLRDVYLAPRSGSWSLKDTLAGRPAPWAESLNAAPEATAAAVEAALVAVMRGTSALDPAELRPEALKEGRARTHLTALRDLWRDLETLPPPFDTIAHVLRCEARDALEPLPVLDPAICPHADALETALQEHLRAHHATAPQAALDAWRARQASSEGQAQGALGAIQRGLGRSAQSVSRDSSLSVFGLAGHCARRPSSRRPARRACSTTEWSPRHRTSVVLAPDDTAYLLALSGGLRPSRPPACLVYPTTPARRDAAGEILSALLAVLHGPAPRTALATLYSHPAMPWPGATGRQMAREVIDSGWSRTAEKLREQGMAVLDALRPASSPDQLVARLFAVAEALPAPRPGAADRRAAGLSGRQPRLADDTPSGGAHARPRRGGRPVRRGRLALHRGGASMASRPAPDRARNGGPRMAATACVEPVLHRKRDRAHSRCDRAFLKGRREHLARGLELFRRQLCAATEGLTLTVPARDLRGETWPPSVALALISHLLGAKEPEIS